MQPFNFLAQQDNNSNLITSSYLPSSQSINPDSSHLLNTFQTNVFSTPPNSKAKRLYQKWQSSSLQKVSSRNVLGSNNLFLNQRSDQEILKQRKSGIQIKHHSGEIIPVYEKNSLARAKSRLSRQSTIFSKVWTHKNYS